jgi:hypothetical protein
LDFTVHKGEDGEIVAETDPFARMDTRPNLPNDDISSPDGFAAVFFHAPPLPIGIPTVAA